MPRKPFATLKFAAQVASERLSGSAVFPGSAIGMAKCGEGLPPPTVPTLVEGVKVCSSERSSAIDPLQPHTPGRIDRTKADGPLPVRV